MFFFYSVNNNVQVLFPLTHATFFSHQKQNLQIFSAFYLFFLFVILCSTAKTLTGETVNSPFYLIFIPVSSLCRTGTIYWGLITTVRWIFSLPAVQWTPVAPTTLSPQKLRACPLYVTHSGWICLLYDVWFSLFALHIWFRSWWIWCTLFG